MRCFPAKFLAAALRKPAILLLAGGLALNSASAKALYRLTLDARPVDRAGEVIEFNLPANLPPDVALRDPKGESIALQVGPDGTAAFIVPRQPADTALEYWLTGETTPAPRGVNAAQENDEIRLSVDGHLVLAYRMNPRAAVRAGIEEKFKRAGYLHPLLTPAGQVVTEDAPTNHPHHHGIWSAWSVTKFQGREPNFWELGQKKGTVEFTGLDRQWSGPVHGGFISRQRMVDFTAAQPIGVLDETWQVTLYNLAASPLPLRMVDLTSAQKCSGPAALRLPEYRYGGLGFRGADSWDGTKGLVVLTSEGETDRIKANTSRARWCYLGAAPSGSGAAGIVILGHPDNFRSPQPLRIHPDMPFFSYAPTQLGEFAIEPGSPLVERYRFLTLDGAPDRALFEAYWQGYAHPAKATLEALR